MQKLPWLHHIGSLEDGIELVNKLFWNIALVKRDQQWYVYGGEKVIFCADSREAVDAFLYGLALAYAVLPEHIFEQIEDGMKELVS